MKKNTWQSFLSELVSLLFFTTANGCYCFLYRNKSSEIYVRNTSFRVKKTSQNASQSKQNATQSLLNAAFCLLNATQSLLDAPLSLIGKASRLLNKASGKLRTASGLLYASQSLHNVAQSLHHASQSLLYATSREFKTVTAFLKKYLSTILFFVWLIFLEIFKICCKGYVFAPQYNLRGLHLTLINTD